MSSNVTLPTYITESVDDIHNRMIEAAPSNVNTIEGDIFWDNTRPIAEEIAKIRNIGFKKLLYSRFTQTAEEDEDLDFKGNEIGLPRKEADYAIQKIQIIGKEGTIIEKNRIACTAATEEVKSIEFAINETATIDSSGEIIVKATCTEAGIIGNVALGNIKILAKSLDGVSSVSNIEIVKLGVDKEDNESYRKRILERKQNPLTSGNKYEYEYWAKQVTGTGYAKCVPGAGNVKVIITNSNKRAASEELIQEVYDYIDNIRPVLAGTLTVATVKEISINIAVDVEIDTSVILGDVQELFKNIIEDYFNNTVYNTKKISIAKLNALLMDINGVVDADNLKINGGSNNITLAEDEIAVVGNVELGVI